MSRNNRCFHRFSASMRRHAPLRIPRKREESCLRIQILRIEIERKKKKEKLEEKLSDCSKRRFVSGGRSLLERIGLERGSSDRGECADRRRSVGWARSGIWSVARLGRWTLRGRRDAGAGTKLTGGRHAVWPCFVSDAAAAARRDALSRSTTGRPNRSAAAVSDCCDAACHAVPGRLQQDRHRKPSSSCVSLHLLTFLLTSSTSEENRQAFDLRPILLLLFSSCSLTFLNADEVAIAHPLDERRGTRKLRHFAFDFLRFSMASRDCNAFFVLFDHHCG